MIIGNFIRDAKADTYAGDITTLSFTRSNVLFRPVDKNSNGGPDYRIVTETAFGAVEFGAAWKRKSKKSKAKFLSVSIDDPALDGPVNAALFTAEDGKTSQLVWSRRKEESDAPEASEEAAG